MNMEKRIRVLEVEAAMQSAFDSLGGPDVFLQWAEANPRDFKKVMSRYLPAHLFAPEQPGMVTLGQLLGLVDKSEEEGSQP